MFEIILIIGTVCGVSAFIGWKLKEITDAYYHNAPHWGFSVEQQRKDNDWFRDQYKDI